jgi:hypothetical protein
MDEVISICMGHAGVAVVHEGKQYVENSNKDKCRRCVALSDTPRRMKGMA